MPPGLSNKVNAAADKDGSNVHDDLVEKPSLKTLAGDVGAEDYHIRAIRGPLDACHRILDPHAEELAGHTLHDRRLRRRVVTQHKEWPTESASIEARLQAVLHILRAPANQQRSRRSDDLVCGLARPAIDIENPPHTCRSSGGQQKHLACCLILCRLIVECAAAMNAAEFVECCIVQSMLANLAPDVEHRPLRARKFDIRLA